VSFTIRKSTEWALIRKVLKNCFKAISTTSSMAQIFCPRNRVKLNRDRGRNEKLRDWTIEEVWVSLPNRIKPMINEEKIFNKQDLRSPRVSGRRRDRGVSEREV